MTTDNQQQQTEPKEYGWVLLEIMGHRQRIGRAKEEDVAGGLMLRIDIPVDGEDDEYVTEYYGTSSIYALRPISEEVAKDHWARSDPRPPKPSTYKTSEQLENHSEDYDDNDGQRY